MRNFILANGFIIHAVHLLKQLGHNLTQKFVFNTQLIGNFWQDPQYFLAEYKLESDDFQVVRDPFCFFLVYIFFPSFSENDSELLKLNANNIVTYFCLGILNLASPPVSAL